MPEKKRAQFAKDVLRNLFKLFPLAALGYIIYRFIQLNVDFTAVIETRFLLLYLALVVALNILSVLLTAFNFVHVLAHVSRVGIPFKEIISVYIQANLYKYFPGNVFHYVGRNSLINNYGIPHKDIAFSTIFEIVGNLVVVIVLSLGFGGPYAFKLLTLLYSTKPGIVYGVIGAGLVFLSVLTILYLCSSRLKDLVHRLVRPRTGRMWLVAAGVFSFNYLINGVSYYLLLRILFVELSGHMLFTVIAAYNLAWFAGFVTPGAPGGIGVKELVLISILGTIASESALLLSVTLHRAALIVSDVTTFVFGRILLRKLSRSGYKP